MSRREDIPKNYRFVINWGNGNPLHTKLPILNKPEAITKAVDKLSALQLLQEKGVRVPEFSTAKPVVGKGSIWFARTNLRGSGGDGIVPVRHGEQVPDARLYVKYVPKLIEYRVHVAGGRVIFAQQKKRKNDVQQDANQKLIRNYANGWVFCPVDVSILTEDTSNVATSAVAGLGLDFGAVDLVIGKHDNLAYVLECNTAPGLESEGLINAYTTYFASLLRTT